jgi:hypothetical protein
LFGIWIVKASPVLAVVAVVAVVAAVGVLEPREYLLATTP